jgi:hypothetical protein
MMINIRSFKGYLMMQTIIRVIVGCTIFFINNVFADDALPLSLVNVSKVALKAKYLALNDQLLNNQFQRELFLVSSESQQELKGEIYAVVNYPFPSVSQALNNPNHWCDALILHVNIKYCRANVAAANTVININLGKKDEQPLSLTYGIAFNYREVFRTTDYFAIELKAANGPLNTHDYSIWIEATPIKDGRTFLHFTYAYAFGFAGRLAMQSYLATTGKNKVGFTITDSQPNIQSFYIQGVRGVVERNTMRYYLAIDAYLFALTTLPKDQLEKRLQKWYDSTEQYATQLHEVERNDYLEMKRNEYKRQQEVQ